MYLNNIYKIFYCQKSVKFFKNWALNIGYPIGWFFRKKSGQSEINFLLSVIVIFVKNKECNFFRRINQFLKDKSNQKIMVFYSCHTT